MIKYIKKNLTIILLELLVCSALIWSAYDSRGYIGFGGETLFTLALIIVNIKLYREDKKNANIV